MAVKTNPVTVVEKNEGTKIEYEQNGTKLYFDDQLMINAAKFQKDWPVHVDVCMAKQILIMHQIEIHILPCCTFLGAVINGNHNSRPLYSGAARE